MDLDAIQAALRSQQIDGWLFYDHHGRDPLAYRILGLEEGLHVTRRWFYLVPVTGAPRKLVHRIEAGRLDRLPGQSEVYSSWEELERELAAMLDGCTRIAMQYSPRNAIPSVSLVDAGTMELVRSMGNHVLSSANLVSEFEAVLSEAQKETHFAAQRKIDAILDACWREMGNRARRSGTTEIAMVEFLQEAMRREGVVWDHGPNVSAGANSADSHYEPRQETTRAIEPGDFVLIDIWGRTDEPNSCFYDVTWTGVIDRGPTEREQRIFETVRNARDATVDLVEQAFAQRRQIEGWEADDAARAVIRAAGYAEWFTHRTGHNIGHVLHGHGANLDNLEAHDERLLLDRTCFSVEPGIYFPGEFGVRSEVDMVVWDGQPKVTGAIQRELVRI